VERVRDFHEVVLGFGDAQAAQEAGRCLQCDLRLSIESNPGPPPRWVLLNRENVLQVPEREGVYHLLDEHQKVLIIKGTADLRRELMGELTQTAQARWFWYEEDKMYSQRESEQLQQYLREHGKMPGGDPDLDDLL
jgi:hypothetical protein